MKNTSKSTNKKVSAKSTEKSTETKTQIEETKNLEELHDDNKIHELSTKKEIRKAEIVQKEKKKKKFYEEMKEFEPVDIHGVLHFARRKRNGVWDILTDSQCKQQAERFYPIFNGKPLRLYADWKTTLCETAAGLVFKPCKNQWDYIYKEDPNSSEYYINLFSGFNVPSIEGDCTKFLDLVLHYLCQDNVECFNQFIGFFAHTLQHPEERTPLIPTIRGRQGTGKTLVVEALASVFDKQYVSFPSANDITGQFNGVLENKLLIVADEATFAGDWNTINRLKNLTGNKTITINHKGIDPYDIDNYARVVIITNKDWAAPIEDGNRRYVLFQTVDEGNPEFCKEVKYELEHGGREALKYYLEHFDLSSYNSHECRVFFEQETKDIQFETMLKTDFIGAYVMACKNDEADDNENIFKAIENDGYCTVSLGYEMAEKWRMGQGCKNPLSKKQLTVGLKRHGITVETMRPNSVTNARCYKFA